MIESSSSTGSPCAPPEAVSMETDSKADVLSTLSYQSKEELPGAESMGVVPDKNSADVLSSDVPATAHAEETEPVDV